jgi:polysaccharide pyruvyl transferase WcaK-like protein
MSYTIDTLTINARFAADLLLCGKDKRKRALYFGWLGYKNLGDEALYYCIHELFKEAFQFRTSGEMDRLYWPGLALSRFSVFFLGGGTLINRNDNVINTLLAYREKIPRSLVLGTGVANEDFWQQFENRSDRLKDWKDFLDSSDFVGVRGPDSMRFMEKLGIDKAVITGDPVLYLGQDTIVPKARRKRVGINFGDTKNKLWGKSDQKVEEEIYRLVKLFLEKGWEISFFNVYEKDTSAFRKFIDRYRLENRIRFFDASSCSMDTALTYFKDVDVFIGEKLHASVFAACTYTPFIMLEYRPKCHDFMCSLDYERYNVRLDQFSADRVCRMAEELQENSGSIQQFLNKKVLHYKNILMASARQIVSQGLQ